MHLPANFKGVPALQHSCYLAIMNEQITIPGPAGALEARHDGEEDNGIAVLCHPHPLYGGSMDDGVLAVLADVLHAHGIATLRFNFRGVGRSEGRHDGSGGEVDDLRAAIAWAREAHPDAPLLLGGYSFGASTLCQLLAGAGAPSVERVLLIAPPVGNLPAPEPGQPTDVFVGDADAFVDPSALAEWHRASIHTLPGADHFFAGEWQALAQAIHGALDGGA